MATYNERGEIVQLSEKSCYKRGEIGGERSLVYLISKDEGGKLGKWD